VYLSLWIVLFGLLGLYLLGKLKLSHDDHLPLNEYGQSFLSVTRLFFAIATIAFTIYMIPGLWGAPLNGISGWLPENKTQDFNLERLFRNSAQQNDTTTSLIQSKTIKPKNILIYFNQKYQVLKVFLIMMKHLQQREN
jgi:thiol:disulfide interchange protein DsbD